MSEGDKHDPKDRTQFLSVVDHFQRHRLGTSEMPINMNDGFRIARVTLVERDYSDVKFHC
jgi:hypothetical protein